MSLQHLYFWRCHIWWHFFFCAKCSFDRHQWAYSDIFFPLTNVLFYCSAATDYFKKWIEAISSRQATDTSIITLLETNILSRFGCPTKIISDNEAAFKSKRMIDFCNKYHITLGHSITYYPQGNGLAESSNKSLVNIIKKLLEDNKKTWNKMLVNALWANRLTTKKSIGTSPYQLVYGMKAIFPSSLGTPMTKLLQEFQVEPNSINRRINQTIHLKQTREEVYIRSYVV